jgi:hypothetical protein
MKTTQDPEAAETVQIEDGPAVAPAATCSVFWVDARRELPDDDMTVLVALDDGEVWTGYMDAGIWRYVSADAIDATVTHWAEFPSPSNRELSQPPSVDNT